VPFYFDHGASIAFDIYPAGLKKLIVCAPAVLQRAKARSSRNRGMACALHLGIQSLKKRSIKKKIFMSYTQAFVISKA
jgi:hypothetical protein